MLIVNIKEAGKVAHCFYCSSVVGKVDDDSILFDRCPTIPYFHDTMLRNCGLYHGRNVENHGHYYEIFVRPVVNMVSTNKLVIRVLNSYKYGNGNICSSFDDRRLKNSGGIYKRYEDCEPDSVTKGLVLAPSITSNLVIAYFSVFVFTTFS